MRRRRVLTKADCPHAWIYVGTYLERQENEYECARCRKRSRIKRGSRTDSRRLRR